MHIEDKFQVIETFNGGVTVVEHVDERMHDIGHDYPYSTFNWRVAFETPREAWLTVAYILELEQLFSPPRR